MKSMLRSCANFSASSGLGVLIPICSSSNLHFIINSTSFFYYDHKHVTNTKSQKTAALRSHGEHQQGAGGQGQQTDEVLGDGELPELLQGVVAKAHAHGGQAVDGQEVPAPAGDHDGGGGGDGIPAQADAGGHGHGGEHQHGADGGAGQGGQDAGQDAEHEDQDEGVDAAAQHTGDGLADQVGQTGDAQSLGHADDAGGHEDDGGAQAAADLLEGQDLGQQQHAHGGSDHGVALIADVALGHHADDGSGEAAVDHILLPGGQSLGLLGHRGGVLHRLGHVLGGHELIGHQAPDQEGQGQDQVDDGELGQGDAHSRAAGLQDRQNVAVLQSGVHGEQGVVAGEARGHQELGPGQGLGGRDGGQQAQDHDVVRGGTGAEEAGAQHGHQDDQHIGLIAALGGHAHDGPLEGRDEAGLLQRGDDDHEGRQHDDAGVGKAAERGGDVGHPEEDHQRAGDHGGRPEGDLVRHDQPDHEDGDKKRDYHWDCHNFLSPPTILGPRGPIGHQGPVPGRTPSLSVRRRPAGRTPARSRAASFFRSPAEAEGPGAAAQAAPTVPSPPGASIRNESQSSETLPKGSYALRFSARRMP